MAHSGSPHQTFAAARIDPGTEIAERLSIDRRAIPDHAGRRGPPDSIPIVAGIVIVPRRGTGLAIGIFGIVSTGGASRAESMQSRRHLVSITWRPQDGSDIYFPAVLPVPHLDDQPTAQARSTPYR